LWERSLHVPLLVAGPGVRPGARCEQPVSLSGRSQPAGTADGRSLMPASVEVAECP
jgi:hypothetical protein